MHHLETRRVICRKMCQGQDPRETDQVDAVEGGGHTLEVFDQGRYVGVLKLYDPDGGAADEDYANARTGSKAEIEAVRCAVIADSGAAKTVVKDAADMFRRRSGSNDAVEVART